MPNVLHSQMLL